MSEPVDLSTLRADMQAKATAMFLRGDCSIAEWRRGTDWLTGVDADLGPLEKVNNDKGEK
jgi:hypothetical protein